MQGGGAPGGTGDGAEAGVKSGRVTSSVIAREKSADRKELVSDSVTQLVGLYSMTMAALLGIFVESTCAPNAVSSEVHQCGLEDLKDGVVLQRATLAINFLCLLVFVAAEVAFWMRERFIIEHFEEDEERPEDALPEELLAYPAFSDQLQAHNKRSYLASEAMMAVLVVNFVVSAALILSPAHFAGKTSVVGLLSNTLLCAGKAWSYRGICKKCMETDSATSLFESEPKSSNAVAPDKRFAAGVYDPEAAAAAEGKKAASKEEAKPRKESSAASSDAPPAKPANKAAAKKREAAQAEPEAPPARPKGPRAAQRAQPPPTSPREMERRGGGGARS